MTEPLGEGPFQALADKISREHGFGVASYKEKCLRRRIAVRMRARGVHTYDDYARVLDADAREYELLLDALTINVTKLFRNWDVFDAVARQVVPALWAAQGPIRVWSAGCASGEEPYSLAVLFLRHADALGERERTGRVRILGTDIDRGSLAAARQATFPEAAFQDTPADLRAHYFDAQPPFRIHDAARAMVQVERHDLLADTPPDGPFELIVCRNVLIYLDRAAQERVLHCFHAALAPGGFLVLGKVESLLGPARSRFAAVALRERIFRRL